MVGLVYLKYVCYQIRKGVPSPNQRRNRKKLDLVYHRRLILICINVKIVNSRKAGANNSQASPVVLVTTSTYQSMVAH